MHMFDLVVLLLFSVMIYLGMTKGLLQTLFSFVRFGLAALVTFLFHGQFKQLLISITPLEDMIGDFVGKRLIGLGGQAAETTVNMVDFEVMKGIPMPKFIREELINRLTEGIESQSASVLGALTDMTMTCISIVLMFIVIYLLLAVLFGMINGLSKLPVINTFNKLGGAGIGAVNAYLLSSVVVVTMLATNTMFSVASFQAALSESIIYKWLLEYNVFVLFLKMF